MKRFLIISLLTMLVYQGRAQEQMTKKQQADKLFERYEYSKSLAIYLNLLEKKSDILIEERVAECYRKMNLYKEAEKRYAIAVRNPKARISSSYYYAEALLSNQKFEEAKAQFRKYYTQIRNPAELAMKLASCDSAALWIDHPNQYQIQNVNQLNSEYSDWGINYFGNTGFIFCSDRLPGDIKKENDIYPWTGDGWLKLYSTNQQMEIEGEIILNNEYHNGPVAFSSAQDTAYITITTVSAKNNIVTDKIAGSSQRLYTRRLELIRAVKKDGKWESFLAFPYNNRNRYSVGHAALSNDGRLLYFTSDMPGGEGKTDLWYCQKQADGIWGKPVNCGKLINTKEEEAFPTIGTNGVLYFASKGLPGMGGYDIFSSTGERNAWSKPVNFKYPVNSTNDDFWLISRDGLSGYFSSNREGGKGSDDIYSFTAGAVVKGPVLSAEVIRAKDPVPADPKLTILPTGSLTTGSSFILKNIYYDLDQSFIRSDAASELDKLFAILQENPAIKIELSSHTDSRAPDNYNMDLSQRRADAAVSYLVKKGVSAGRMIAKGYGESQLVNRCANGITCSEEEHQMNRRTEIKVVE